MADRFLRKAGEPHVYEWTPLLAARVDMVPCYADGNLVNPMAEVAILGAREPKPETPMMDVMKMAEGEGKKKGKSL